MSQFVANKKKHHDFSMLVDKNIRLVNLAAFLAGIEGYI